MPQPSRRPRPWTSIATAGAAVGACAVCCVGPILAFFGGLSIVSLAGSIWIPALAIVAVAAVVGAVWMWRRRDNSNCQTDGGQSQGLIDLGMPTPAASSVPSTTRTGTGASQ